MPLDRSELHESAPLEPMTRSHARTAPRKQKRVIFITGVVLAVIVAGFYTYQQFVKQTTVAMLSRPRPPTPIETVAAALESVPQSLSGIGTLQAVHQVTIAPEIGGRVVQIHFEPGATVKAGDPLLQLFDAPERGDLANFEAQLRLAGANLDRDKALSTRDFQSRQVVDQRQSLLDQSRASIAKTEAVISQKLIRAPFSGQLGVRQVEVGAYVTPGGPIVTLTDLSTLWVNFTLPEQVVSKIHVGQKAHVRADAYPDRVFEATVTAIEPQISVQTRTLLVQATLDNADHALLPGMFAKAEVVLPETPNVVVVPETAVDYSLYGDSVFVIREDGADKAGKPILKATRIGVKTGDRFNGKVTIVSGLKGGEQIAASGQLRLTNGAAVTIEPGNTLATRPATNKY